MTGESCAAGTPTTAPTPAFTPAAGCSYTPPAGVLSATIVGVPGFSKATFTNTSSSCSYLIGFASYKEFDSNIDHQELFDYSLTVIPPSSSITLMVAKPPCAFQVDAFYGSLIMSFANGDRYDTRLLAAAHGNTYNYCQQQCVTPVSTRTCTPNPW